MKKFVVKTLGCKANSSDGQLLEVGLRARGFESTRETSEADLIIVNSCTVTNEADRQSAKLVRDLHKRHPNAKIVYTGCAAEVNPEAALKIPGVSAVLGNQNKDSAATLIDQFFGVSTEAALETIESQSQFPVILGGVSGYGELRSKHPIDREWPMPDSSFSSVLSLGEESSTYRTRAFVKIQDGCNSFCTYCIIPYGRGPARSLSIDTVVEQIQKLVDSGTKEVILTGINIGDYGIDFAGSLQIDSLLEAILTRTSLERLRISSLDPTEISDRMIELVETYPAFCPHFHVSLQHVSSKVLKLMKRKYAFEAVETLFQKFSQMKRKPFIGMDFITGFPGETAEDFEDAKEKLHGLYWSRIHVFPYSERAGTPATKLPHKVPEPIRKERARELSAMSLDRMVSFHAATRSEFQNGESGMLKGVLLESEVKGPDGTRDWLSGYAPNYQRVLLKVPKAGRRNTVVDVPISRWIVEKASGEVTWIGEAT